MNTTTHRTTPTQTLRTTTRPATRAVAVVAALAAALTASACSKADSPTPAATSASPATTSAPTPTSSGDPAGAPAAASLLATAKSNALGATSGAFVGWVTQKGQRIDIDFKGTKDGRTSDVTITLGPQGRARLVTVPEGVFIQGDATFWKLQGAPASVQKAGTKFIKAPSSASSMTSSLSLGSFLSKAFSAVTADRLSPTVGEESVGGVDCWVLSDKKGRAQGALYVSKDASQIVRFTGSTSSPGQIDFSRWNEDLGIAAPPKDQVMTITG